MDPLANDSSTKIKIFLMFFLKGKLRILKIFSLWVTVSLLAYFSFSTVMLYFRVGAVSEAGYSSGVNSPCCRANVASEGSEGTTTSDATDPGPSTVLQTEPRISSHFRRFSSNSTLGAACRFDVIRVVCFAAADAAAISCFFAWYRSGRYNFAYCRISIISSSSQTKLFGP